MLGTVCSTTTAFSVNQRVMFNQVIYSLDFDKKSHKNSLKSYSFTCIIIHILKNNQTSCVYEIHYKSSTLSACLNHLYNCTLAVHFATFHFLTYQFPHLCLRWRHWVGVRGTDVTPYSARHRRVKRQLLLTCEVSKNCFLAFVSSTNVRGFPCPVLKCKLSLIDDQHLNPHGTGFMSK